MGFVSFAARLDDLEGRYEAACIRMGVANWNNYARQGPADLDGAREAFRSLFSDDILRRALEAELERAGRDGIWRRRLEMWHRCFIGGRIEGDSQIALLENKLEKRLTDFVFELDGQPLARSELQRRLRRSTDPDERRHLWHLSHTLHRVMEADLRELVRHRNRLAARAGFENFYSLSLYLQDIDELALLQMLETLELSSRPPYERFLTETRSRLAVEALGPWDLPHAVHQLASLDDAWFPREQIFPRLKEIHRRMGFPVDTLPIREAVVDIPYGGLSLAVQIPTDARFLVNPSDGHRFYQTGFHEYGHSLQAVTTAVDYPILKGYEWIPGALCPAFSEGVAEVHGEMASRRLWLIEDAGVSASEVRRFEREGAFARLFRLRSLLASFHFEYALYRNPEQDLTRCQQEVTRRYLLVDLGEGEPGRWAADTWYTAYPCYYQSYILASVIAAQIHAALERDVGVDFVHRTESATWLVERLYRRGESQPWPERLSKATGAPLDARLYLAALRPQA